ncbi:DUF559 domain-containing protein [Leifsonia sp. L25]|uniref:DUF559 domain-containing protein n=1 Tax=Actinomycetes TaxID=1760 RepID=UPI003D68A903
MELQVRQKLVEAGFKVHKGRSAIQCEYDPVGKNYPVLTPDILLSGTKVCIEVDTDRTHPNADNDRRRDALLAAVGWTVVRLRLGALEPLGPYDVASESSSPTAAAIAALIESLHDAVAVRPGTVRGVTKKVVTRKTAPSPLGAIAAHKYWDAAYYCSYDGHRMVIMAEGRYLGGHGEHSDVDYICDLALHGIPRAKWRAAIEPVLAEMTSFQPISRFPWGDDLWVGKYAPITFVKNKFNPGGEAWVMTTNATGTDLFDDDGLLAGEERLLALHPGAREFGWRVADVTLMTGYAGPYQKVLLVRDELETPSE